MLTLIENLFIGVVAVVVIGIVLWIAASVISAIITLCALAWSCGWKRCLAVAGYCVLAAYSLWFFGSLIRPVLEKINA